VPSILHEMELVSMVLPEAARSALEAMMTSGSYEYQSELVKRWVREVAEAKAEGRAEGKAEDVLQLLEARSVAVSDEVRARIMACRDLAQLERWLLRAATVTAVDELFG
jgi:Arc/MetJ-type ribon-helix-helix transcriptional regulator